MKTNLKFYSNKGVYQLLKFQIDKMHYLEPAEIIDNLINQFELSESQIKFIKNKIQ